jgi:hypothetical protein
MNLQNAPNFATLVLVALALVIPVQAASMLYAPTWSDNPTFRTQLSELIGGPVDYWNAYTQGVPPLSVLLEYNMVFTWVNYPYADPVLMGDRLADYVDLGGRVSLGAWCYHIDQSNYLQGRIMTPPYFPAASVSSWAGEYTGGGVDCVHEGVGAYSMQPILTLNPGAVGDGSTGASPPWSTAWREDRAVYYSGGNIGFLQLTANMALCLPQQQVLGDLNCDGEVNGYDIDPFVLALTDPSAYDEQLADCDYMLADCNQDGAVNGYDIDPFVELLTSR